MNEGHKWAFGRATPKPDRSLHEPGRRRVGRTPLEGVSKFKTQIVENKGILWFFDSEKAKGLKGAIPSVPVPIHEATQPEMVL